MHSGVAACAPIPSARLSSRSSFNRFRRFVAFRLRTRLELFHRKESSTGLAAVRRWCTASSIASSHRRAVIPWAFYFGHARQLKLRQGKEVIKRWTGRLESSSAGGNGSSAGLSKGRDASDRERILVSWLAHREYKVPLTGHTFFLRGFPRLPNSSSLAQ